MVDGLVPALVMILVQIEFSGMNIFSKLAMDTGMNPFIHVAYRQIFAFLFVAPVAYFVERYTYAFLMLKPNFICMLSLAYCKSVHVKRG